MIKKVAMQTPSVQEQKANTTIQTNRDYNGTYFNNDNNGIYKEYKKSKKPLLALLLNKKRG